MTMQFRKQIENQSQSGRSMIEMLGVLAIIAILSIGGIVGYKLAMNYYQADQVANEINLMRNDLKVKYALGNEELILGDPYDDTPENEHYSGHLSTQYDRYPVDYDCIRKDKAEFYNCRETDAYYIKVGNVSKGVCKPLTTLVSAMDGLMYMEINKEVYKEDDLCDENNEFYIQFDAEEVNGNYDSGRPEDWCAKDEDCEEPQVCDKESNMCVECTENAHCTSNICRKNHTCGECTSDSDCVNPHPICDTESATCVGCAVDDECPDMNKPNCDTASGACCDDPLMTWNGSECVCPEGQEWKESAHGCVSYECRTNEECNPDGGFDNYCYLLHGVNGTNEWQDDDPNGENYSGKCHKVSDDLLRKEPTIIQNIKFYGSTKPMNWWSNCRFCAARAGVSDKDCVGTAEGPSFMLGYKDIDWQCHKLVPTGTGSKNNYCTNTDETPGINNVSPTIKEFRKMFDNDENYTGDRWLWFRDNTPKGLVISDGIIVSSESNRHNIHDYDRALCRE